MKEFLIKDEVQDICKILGEPKLNHCYLMMNVELACSANCRNRRFANCYVKNNIKDIMKGKLNVNQR